LSPFLACANAPCKEHPTDSVLGHIWFLKIIDGYKWTKWTFIHNTLVFCLFDHFASKMGLQTSKPIMNRFHNFFGMKTKDGMMIGLDYCINSMIWRIVICSLVPFHFMLYWTRD
jgi:hypothetical protein